MTDTIKLMKESDIRRIGTEALVKALGPIGRARYLEVYDNGGSGDYTKEKYNEQDITMEEFRQLRDAYYGE
mgnify:FL=1